MWGRDVAGLPQLVRNVGTRYAVVGVDAAIGALLLPFNISHLGSAGWGLWILTSSLNTYFAAIDLGYGGSLTRFVAQYRARRDREAINEILSTVGLVLCGLAVAVLAGFAAAALFVDSLFKLDAGQIATARALVLLNGLQVAVGLPFSIYGGVVNGFQRYDLNSRLAVVNSVAVAIVNVVVLLAGGGLVGLVAATTTVRLAFFGLNRWNAHHVFPGLSVGLSQFRRARLREVSGYSGSVAIITWANRLNYASAQIIIGAVLSPAAVAIWGVPHKLALLVRSLTNQLGAVLMPVVVDSDTRRRSRDLTRLLILGTQIALTMVIPLATCIVLLGDLLIPAWVGPGFEASITIARILAVVMVFRVARTIPTTLLKGTGRHNALAAIDSATAIANIVLSVMWIRAIGLPGVALGILAPLAVSTSFVIWPLACRQAGVGALAAARQAVWPALWPVSILAAAIAGIRTALPGGIIEMIAAGAVGCALYAAVVWGLALSVDDRCMYKAQVLRVLSRKADRRSAAASEFHISDKNHTQAASTIIHAP